jgi:murein DD-endopeptidase MepM/ murein hydrolase activator NlpD
LWYGLSGVGLDTAPGTYQLRLDGSTASGVQTSFTQMVTVGKATYRIITLSVPRKYTEPDAETLARIKREQELKNGVFARVSPERAWAGRFVAPVAGGTSEVFGTQRTFNGVRQGVHQGLDYRAPTGTPVAAMNSGQVILARELFFEGNCVVIDHGQGLLTLYLHLSQFKIKEGESVKRGQVIGLSGATGRVTGPHLHAAVRWRGVYLNPATLLTLTLP